MCQPKDKGGKRCSVHQAGSKFSMRVAKLKTGADDATVKETFTELTKEGRPLPTPSKEEVEAFIEKKRFATELDPELDAHERKIELSQLARAEKELDSVTGASFHAWKNLRKRVAEKMKAVAVKIRKPVLAFGLAGAVLFGAAGCGAQNANPDEPINAPSSTSQPTTAPTPTSAPVDTTTKYGDAVGFENVTDANGNYLHLTASPDDDSMQLDATKYDTASLEAAGFTQEDALSAQQWASKFVVENSLDSEALDTTDGWDKWVATKSDQYLAPNQKDEILKPLDGTDRSGVIFNNPSNYLPVLSRDGAPRVSSLTLNTDSVSGHTEDGGGYIKVVTSAEAVYRYPEAPVQQKFRDSNPTLTEDQLKEAMPGYFDGAPENYIVQSKWTYYLQKADTGWQIAGYSAKKEALG